jgi:hypothetical protein
LHVVVSAENNIFTAGVDPATVIDDFTHGSATGQGTIDVSLPLAPDQAFVQTLYNGVLGRTGAPGELAAWVNALHSQGREFVVDRILHSAESNARVVDRLYIQLLKRAPGVSELAAWTGFLNAGNSTEQLEDAIVTSPEYLVLEQLNWVRSLYLNFLNRDAAEEELVAWNDAAQSIGLAGIGAAIISSPEARFDSARSLYCTFLHRNPSPWEPSSLVGLSVDLMQEFILASAEYYTNG